MGKRVEILRQNIENPERKKLVTDFISGVKTYEAGFDQVYSVITERNKLIQDGLDRIGPEVMNASLGLKNSNQDKQDVPGPQAVSFIDTVLVVV